MYYYIFKTSIGNLLIEETDDRITKVTTSTKITGSDYINKKTKLIANCAKQIDEYLDGKRTVFDIPIHLKGTEFQKKVWNALLKIPYGRTLSYSDIATCIGSEKAVRAVGGANNKNPIMIIVPCHRVIGKDGSLVGYGGGTKMKEKLLELEAKNE